MSSPVFTLLLLLPLLAVTADAQDAFAADVESILSNQRVLNAYLKCFLSTGPCTKEGREMKRMLPEVLKTACKSCNQTNKENFRKFLRRIQIDPKLSDAWDKVMKKYDPRKQYQAGIDKFLKEGNGLA